ncbi:ATP-binding cassette domain-containing protein [Arthrobacter sp. efr-133-R2A-120]|uniref:ABC transporter ATP-binding protein n=1 Tax=Arthrobacter sp. efr-133-R2A-120 TaxID=3040277 RepID=UPI00254DE1C1|nr:ATP-binding cassette domain-containing protein [Arthrobacter sp. efr-133-R2A-120]
MEIPTGSVFAFLGTNGAGKSTTISCMTTSLPFDEGVIVINGNTIGKDDERIRRDIGVVFQQSLLDPLATPVENLRLRAGFYNLGSKTESRIKELTDLVDLGDFSSRRYGLLSGGQKRRVDIARALIHSPSVIFLDEPTAGLDPQSREKVWEAINTLREEQGLTVFLTTHYMQETENADEVVIIDKGRRVAAGTPAELRSQYSRSVLTIQSSAQDRLKRTVTDLGLTFEARTDVLEIDVETAQDALAVITAHREHIGHFELRHGTMDDVFLALTGKA